MNDVFPVVVGIDLDAEAIWIGKQPENANRPVLLSEGTFAIREGLEPLLALLNEHRVRATFYIPGLTADRYPDAVRKVAAAGHDIGSHGHGHKPAQTLSAEEEKKELVGGIESLARITGTRPRIWRSPSWEWSAHTLDLLLAEGVDVSTNFHDRVRPYRHMRDGNPVKLVELPVQWHLADAPFFMYGGQIGRQIHAAADVERIWMEEFDGLYDWPGAFFHLTLHVQLIGHPGRLAMLNRVLHRIRSRPRAKFFGTAELAATIA